MRYLDWVQIVTYAVLQDRDPRFYFGLASLAKDLDLDLATLTAEEQVALTSALDHALSDIHRHGLVIYEDQYQIKVPPPARRFRTVPLSVAWSEFRSGWVTPDEDAILRALAIRSEVESDRWADTIEVPIATLYGDIGRSWDVMDAVRTHHALRERYWVTGLAPSTSSPGALRITYAGLVRALDDVGGALAEAREHMHVGRLRAAGCVAAVELERRLKLLTAGKPIHVKRRDPGLDDYSQIAFDKQLIDQETWTLVRNMAAIRKRCVHVLDREPTESEVGELIDGVEKTLRKYPAPA